MLSNISTITYTLFALAVIFATLQFYRASGRKSAVLLIIILWGSLHSILAYLGFYRDNYNFPPRVSLLLIPFLGFVLALLVSVKFRERLKTLDLKKLTYLHFLRLPIEIVLHTLFLSDYFPQLATYEGLNFDIIMGISAPIMAFYCFRNGAVKRMPLLVWNIVSIILLLNVVSIAVLSIPSSVQQLSFEQPNIAVTLFPIVLLPAVVVPIVLVSNVSALLQLFDLNKSIEKVRA